MSCGCCSTPQCQSDSTPPATLSDQEIDSSTITNSTITGSSVTGLPDPVEATDAATKEYVDASFPNDWGTLASGEAVQRRRGTAVQHDTFTGLIGELTVDTTRKTARIHDGTTAGGFPLTRMDQLAVNVKNYGAVGDGVTDDTAAIQACLDANYYVYFPPGRYAVTQITLGLAGSVIDFRNAIIIGIASTSTGGCVQIKAGSSYLWGLNVASNQNTNYVCGVHWYTNDLNTYNPGHLQVFGCKVTSFLNGMVIGALPSQADPIPAQGTVQPNGVATDAPLSESFIEGFFTSNCVRSLYMRQPNGKVTLVSPEIQGEYLQWGAGQVANCTALAVANSGSELVVIGGACEQNQSNSGAFIQVVAGNVKFIGTTIEAQAPSYIAGDAKVVFEACIDMGWNNLSYWPFNVQAAATGRLLFADCTINLPEGNYATGNRPFVKAVTDSSYSFSPNLGFIVEFRNSELRDLCLDGTSEYLPLVLGLRAKFAECHLTSYTAGSRTISQRLRTSTDVLAGAFDQTANSFSAYPQTGTPTTEAGMTFTINVLGSQWGSESSGLPTVEGETISRAIRLKSAGGAGYASAQSAAVPITPGVPMVLSGFIKTGTGASINLVRVLFFKFDGTTAASTANQDVISCQESGVGSTWQSMCFTVTPPADCSKVALFVYAQNGSEIQLANVSLWQ